MSSGLHFSSNGMMYIGDSDPIPVTNVRTEWQLTRPESPSPYATAKTIPGEVIRGELESAAEPLADQDPPALP